MRSVGTWRTLASAGATRREWVAKTLTFTPGADGLMAASKITLEAARQLCKIRILYTAIKCVQREKQMRFHLNTIEAQKAPVLIRYFASRTNFQSPI
jgi:hypothetical protein